MNVWEKAKDILIETNLVRAHLPRAINTVKRTHVHLQTPANHFDSKERLRGSVAGLEMIQKTMICWEIMGNSLWSWKIHLAFAKLQRILPPLNYWTKNDAALKWEVSGKSSGHLQMYYAFTKHCLFSRQGSVQLLMENPFLLRQAERVIPIFINGYTFYFCPEVVFILMRSKTPFILLKGCLTSLP